MKIWTGSTLVLGITLCTAQAEVSSQQIEQSLDLRERWMGLTRDVLLAPQWTDDNQSFYYKLSVEGGFRFYLDQLQPGHRDVAFDHQRISDALNKATGGHTSALQLPFDSFSYGPDADIRFYYDDSLWSCALDGSHCARQQRQGQPKAFGVVRDLRVAPQNSARVSPDGRYQAQTVGHNLRISDAKGATVLESTDGSAENFYDPQSIQWAPDSSALLVLKVKPGTARLVSRVLAAPTDQLEPKTITQLYPKPGDAVDVEQPVLVQLASRLLQPIDPQLFANPYSLDELQWRADSSGFVFKYTERGHQLARVVAVDAKTAQASALITEQSPTFIDQWGGSYLQLLEGKSPGVLWLSERDGWAHLYRYNNQGQLLNQVTQGQWRVRAVQRVDEAGQQIWFSASGMDPKQDPYFVHYYRINFDGSGLTALTSANATHEVVYSPDFSHYIDLYSRVDLPNQAELRRSSDGSLVRLLAKGDISRLTAAGFKAPTPFVSKGRDGKTDIWGLLVRPQQFDPNKSYPVIENIYAGPHSSFVPKSFWPFGYHSGGDKVIGMQALADLGFIVVQIDGMGTGNRSKAFHDVAWRDLADSGFPDRMLWHKAAAAQFPWYSLQHGVGIYGASAGGQSTVGALVFHPEFYRVGVAYAGCYDNRMDKISWNEQWLGYPVGEQYRASSVTEHASQLRGKLLIVNGEQDSNVDPASTMQLVNALINADKDFDLLLVPGGEHTVGRSSGPIRYVQRRQFDFFLRHLQQQQTPDWNK
ncbi:DPP IV N-terminal domain-containing protein [Rheinheimera sp.]|uniref:S9 family peptidase n=1 Tax=Rheinheimera sp. TaxID=1869214 RepID=UPI003AF42520